MSKRAVIVARLPKDRMSNGVLTVVSEDGDVVAGPFRCFGKSDNARAAINWNKSRNPALKKLIS